VSMTKVVSFELTLEPVASIRRALSSKVIMCVSGTSQLQ
jgi:hypothetical protein